MAPIISVFAIPIAGSLAVGITIGNIFARDELLLFHYFSEARKKIELAIWIFSFVLLIFYIPLLLKFAPEGYWNGKKFLISAAQGQIENLPANKFHQIGSRCTIFFQEKETCTEKQKATTFKNIFLNVKQKNKKPDAKNSKEFFVSAKMGKIKDGILTLENGNIYNKGVGSKKYYLTAFKALEIAFEKILLNKKNNFLEKPSKFLTGQEIIAIQHENGPAWQEFHKRLGQILWQLLLPFLVFWLMMILGRPKSNVLLSIVVSGGLFLFSYISLNMAYFLLKKPAFGWFDVRLSIFYAIPLGTATLLYILYKKKWP